jgi:hypothetical protein
MVLPNGTSVDEEAISRIGNIIRTAISNAPAVKVQLANARLMIGKSKCREAHS